jgi:phage terminase large subunit GpA-like protein
VWIHGYAGDGKATSDDESGTGPDHYRDCFNYAYAAAKLAGLDKRLFNETYCNTAMANKMKPLPEPAPRQQRQEPAQEIERTRSHLNHRQGGYFRRAYGRGFR